MTKREKIIEALEDMATAELVAVYNEYADEVRCEKIWDNDIDEILQGSTPMQVYYSLASDWAPFDEYVVFDGYGRLESFSPCQILDYVFIEEIAEYIIDNEDALLNSEIQEILDEE